MTDELDDDEKAIVLAVADAIRAVGTDQFDAAISRGLEVDRFVGALAVAARSAIEISGDDVDALLNSMVATAMGSDELGARRARRPNR